MLKLSILGICIVVIGVILRNSREEYGILLGLAGVCISGGYVMLQLKNVLALLQEFGGEIQFGERFFQILFKMIGVCYLADLSSDICKDAGYSALANQITVAGKLTIVGMGIPIIELLLGCLPW